MGWRLLTGLVRMRKREGFSEWLGGGCHRALGCTGFRKRRNPLGGRCRSPFASAWLVDGCVLQSIASRDAALGWQSSYALVWQSSYALGWQSSYALGRGGFVDSSPHGGCRP